MHPLNIKLFNANDKSMLFKALPKLRSFSAPFLKFSVANDLAKDERLEERDLLKKFERRKRIYLGTWSSRYAVFRATRKK